MIFAEQIGFTWGLTGALNVPMVLLVLQAGLVTGIVKGISLRSAHISMDALVLTILFISGLVAFQCITATGSSIYRPSDLETYIGAHIGYIVLSILFGAMVYPGMRLVNFKRQTRQLQEANSMNTPNTLATGPPDEASSLAESLPHADPLPLAESLPLVEPVPVDLAVPFEKPIIIEKLPVTGLLADRLNRTPSLVTPIEDMLRIQNARQYILIVLGILQFVQITALTGYIFLNHVQVLWEIPIVAYTLISSAAILLIVVGLPVIMGLFLRKGRTKKS